MKLQFCNKKNIEQNFFFVLRIISKKMLDILLLNMLLNSLISEHLIRMLSMNNAIDNSKSILSNLNKQYSKKRQHMITDEIMGLISRSKF